MHICFVYKHYPIDGNFDSGIGRYLSDLTQELTKKHKVIILTTSDKPRVIKSKNFTIYAIEYPKYSIRSLSFLKHLINISIQLHMIINKHKINIIEFANWESEGLFFTSTINKILKVPVIIRLHTPSTIDNKYNGEAKYFSARLKERFEKFFVNQKENNLSTSTKFNAKECSKIYGTNKPINIIPLGIPHKNISRPKPSKKPLNTILYIGRLEARKGIDVLIHAIPEVLSKYPDVSFKIVGRENNNYQWINKLRSTIPYKYMDKVNFLGYIGNTSVIHRLYLDADICVIPSRYESFGINVLEAMSYGKIVVTSSSGGIPEVIKDKHNGILMKRLDKTNLANSLLLVIRNQSLKKKLANNAFIDSRMKFNLNKMTNNTLAFYQSCLTGK